MRHEKAVRNYVEYLEGKLLGRRLRHFEEHFHGCKECQAELDALRKLDARLRQEVPAYWQSIEPPSEFVAGGDEDKE